MKAPILAWDKPPLLIGWTVVAVDTFPLLFSGLSNPLGKGYPGLGVVRAMPVPGYGIKVPPAVGHSTYLGLRRGLVKMRTCNVGFTS